MKLKATGLVRIIAGGEWLLVAAAAPLFLFPAPERVPGLLVFPLLLAINGIVWRRVIPITPLNAPLLLLSIMMLVSLWATTDLAASLPKISGLLYGLLVFFVTVLYGQSRRGWLGALVLFCLMGMGIAFISLLGTNWLVYKFEVFKPIVQRLPSFLAGLSGTAAGFHPNEVAGAILWSVPVTASAGLAIVSGKYPLTGIHLRGLWLGCVGLAAIFSLGVVILTQSRSGYIGLALAMMLMIVLALPRRVRWLGLILIVVIGAVGIGIVATHGLHNVMGGLFDQTIVGDSVYSLSSLNVRMDIWSSAVAGIKDFPLTGMGMNRFRTEIHLLYPVFSIPYDYSLGHAHNEFLQVGLDLGIPGMIAFVSIYLVAFWLLVKVYRRAVQMGNDGTTLRWLILGLGGGLFGHLVYGMTDAVALGAKPGILFWMLLGLIVGLHQQATPLNSETTTI